MGAWRHSICKNFKIRQTQTIQDYAAFELGIATGAIGFGAVLARSSFAVMFLTAAAVALIGAALAVSRWKPRPD